ncbi:hypothetical protein GGI43DRAFT_429767 [Trichoderma evansii]
MNELTTSLNGLKVTHVGFADEYTPDWVPFSPSGNLATKLYDTPRYLFRVYSDASAGENSSEMMKSVDALENNLTDIFARHNTSNIASTLKNHLRWWENLFGDPFISWTTSLLVAIQYAIFKHKVQHSKLNTIYLCIIDTTLFPDGVFLKDLDLIEEFLEKAPGHRGLGNLHQLRNRAHKTYSGFYYFGEYLSQGLTKINGRSCVVPCDKIISNHLFAIMPQFKIEIERENPRWAEAVIEFREPFYNKEQEVIDNSKFTEAMAIALEFDTEWVMPMLANLLALSPHTARNPANIDRISKLCSNEIKHSLSSKFTNVVANNKIPEVFEFGKIIHDINKDYYVKSIAVLVRSMKETTDIARRFISDSKTTGGRKKLGTGNLAGCLPPLDHDHVQPLVESVETLSGIIQELQEAMTWKGESEIMWH